MLTQLVTIMTYLLQSTDGVLTFNVAGPRHPNIGTRSEQEVRVHLPVLGLNDAARRPVLKLPQFEPAAGQRPIQRLFVALKSTGRACLLDHTMMTRG